MLQHSALVILLAGIAFLVFGLSQTAEALQKLAANQIRQTLTKLSGAGFLSVVVGVGLTLLMQSSGAVTATLVNLGSARVLSLPEVMGVLIGSAIGAALTVQILSLHITDLGLPFFIIGFTVLYFAKARRIRDSFEFLMGLGLLFFGLELISMGSKALAGVGVVASAMTFIQENPITAIATAAGLTSLFHSSTATLGIVIALSSSGVLKIEDAMFWIYGANIGTASTGLVAALRGDYVGKRIAWANFLYRVATVLIFVPFGGVTLALLQKWFAAPGSQVAFFYTCMNVFSASIFFPLRGLGVRVVENIVQPSEAEREFGVRFLKRSTYESFSIALAHGKRETLEMGDIVYKMVDNSLRLFRRQDPDLLEDIRKCDDRVDLLLKEIKLFLIRVSDLAPEGLNQAVIDLISFSSDLEGIADIVDHRVLELAAKKNKGQFEFDPEDWRHLEELHANVVRAVSLALSGFQTDDPAMGTQLIELKHEIRDQENRAREIHIARLSRSTNPGLGSSSIFLESLGTYLQLVEMLSKHAQRAKLSASKTDTGLKSRAR